MNACVLHNASNATFTTNTGHEPFIQLLVGITLHLPTLHVFNLKPLLLLWVSCSPERFTKWPEVVTTYHTVLKIHGCHFWSSELLGYLFIVWLILLLWLLCFVAVFCCLGCYVVVYSNVAVVMLLRLLSSAKVGLGVLRDRTIAPKNSAFEVWWRIFKFSFGLQK